MENDNAKQPLGERILVILESIKNIIFKYYITVIVWLVILTVSILLLWFLLYPVIWWNELSEIRLYVRVFLLLFAISTFSTLRLYNSVVVNSRFLLKLRESIIKIERLLPRITTLLETSKNSQRDNSSAINRNTTQINKIVESIKKASDEITRASEKLNRK